MLFLCLRYSGSLSVNGRELNIIGKCMDGWMGVIMRLGNFFFILIIFISLVSLPLASEKLNTQLIYCFDLLINT